MTDPVDIRTPEQKMLNYVKKCYVLFTNEKMESADLYKGIKVTRATKIDIIHRGMKFVDKYGHWDASTRTLYFSENTIEMVKLMTL